MLSYHEYRQLNEDLKAQILSWDGVSLDLYRECSKCSVELYALYGFYVEIYFDKFTENPIYLRSFNQTDRLEPYLNQLNIENLMNI
ncbi:MAG TPA: hypothetical protein VHK91_03550 [Flavisolibacter sp.]|jgi:hypothetical protein|nr:hypothetical protein [Flavisolibacter sp.]